MVPLLTPCVTWAVPALSPCSLGEFSTPGPSPDSREEAARCWCPAGGAISAGSAVPGWLRPRGSWAGHRGPAAALVAHCQTAAWAPSSGPRVRSSSPQPAAAAAACSSQTHTGSTPPSPSPGRQRGRHSIRREMQRQVQGRACQRSGSRASLRRHHTLGPDLAGG